MSKLENKLKEHVLILSQKIGERNVYCYEKLKLASEYIKKQFKKYGYNPKTQDYVVRGKKCSNIIAEKKGKKEEIIVGAHYDTIFGTPGADDNASGVAGLLELSRLIRKQKLNKTIKFIAFVNEEPPFFFTKEMGSRVYAKVAKERKDKIVAMFSLEMIGYFKKFPFNFIAVVGNLLSIDLANKVSSQIKNFIPALPFWLPFPGTNFSDHSSFWHRYKAIMITDTAFYRYPYYHSSKDTAEKLNYASMAKVIKGLKAALIELD